MTFMLMLHFHIQESFSKIKWLKSISTSLKMASNQLDHCIEDKLNDTDS